MSSGPQTPPDADASPTKTIPVDWAAGTAYDFFASLFVIHNVESAGLRRAWAAGVRNRLSAPNRELLQAFVPVISVPVRWLGGLGVRPSAEDLIADLATVPDDEVIARLGDEEIVTEPVIARVLESGNFSETDIAAIAADGCAGLDFDDADQARTLLTALACPSVTGARLKTAFVEYYEQFFREEEARIAPYLERALEGAQQIASRTGPVELLEELSGGLRLENVAEARGLLLVPSFWAGPLVLFEMLADGTWVLMFSARPRDVSLIPGDPVPDALTRSLTAVSDQTRLRILKLAARAPRTQAEIARALRLRPPTITHHLRILRMANLVRLTETANGEKRYDVRMNRLEEIADDLKGFVESSEPPPY